jgi:hypothetical protein
MLDCLRREAMDGRSLVTRIAAEGAQVAKIELVED